MKKFKRIFAWIDRNPSLNIIVISITCMYIAFGIRLTLGLIGLSALHALWIKSGDKK